MFISEPRCTCSKDCRFYLLVQICLFLQTHLVNFYLKHLIGTLDSFRLLLALTGIAVSKRDAAVAASFWILIIPFSFSSPVDECCHLDYSSFRSYRKIKLVSFLFVLSLYPNLFKTNLDTRMSISAIKMAVRFRMPSSDFRT